VRDEVGVDRIMWGSDYPHLEGSHPYSREALRVTFSDVDPREVRAMLGENAAALYGFDYDHLQTIADDAGPTVDEVATRLDHVPADGARCPALAEALAQQSTSTGGHS
jgi:hypothetical protein